MQELITFAMPDSRCICNKCPLMNSVHIWQCQSFMRCTDISAAATDDCVPAETTGPLAVVQVYPVTHLERQRPTTSEAVWRNCLELEFNITEESQLLKNTLFTCPTYGQRSKSMMSSLTKDVFGEWPPIKRLLYVREFFHLGILQILITRCSRKFPQIAEHDASKLHNRANFIL